MSRLGHVHVMQRLAARRRSSAAQGGFALMTVLAVLALTSLIIVALIGMAFTTVQFASSQADAARRTRAADGALESAIATMGESTDSSMCPGVRDGSTVTFDNGTPSAGDDDDVVLTCVDAAVSLDPTAPLGGADVKVVGNSGSTLTSSGSEALRFDADVSVRRGADVSTSGSGPAVALTGQYVQGQAGPGGSGTDCTVLDAAAGNPAQSIRDRDDDPACGDTSVADLAVAPQQLVNIDDPIAAPTRTVPACPGSAVVELLPGRYDALQTSALNKLLDGSCPGKVFWFRPSTDPARPAVFAFDANPHRAGGAALVVDDPTARVIVGQPTGGSDAAAAQAAPFPAACDRSVSGASVQLSGRMALRHLAGRVAICPAWNGSDPLPALVQVPDASVDPVTVAASSDNFRLANGQNGGPALMARPDDSSIEATAAFNCAWSGNDTCTAGFSATFANIPGVDQLRSVEVNVATRETPPAPWPTVPRRVVIQLVGAGGAQICQTAAMEGGRTNWQLSSYDLMSDSNCRSALNSKGPSALEGATVNVRYTYGPDGCVLGFDWVYGWTLSCGERLSVRGVRLAVNAAVAEASSASGAGQSNPSAALRDDADATRAAQESCGITAFPCSFDTPGTNHDIEVSDLRFGNGVSGPPSSLRLVVKNTRSAAYGQSWVSDPIDDSRTEIRLTLAGGASCTVTTPGYAHSAQESQYDLLKGGAPGCAGLISDVSQLQGASVRIRYTTGCAWIGGGRAPVGADGRCATVTLPETQYVALTATTTAVADPPPSQVTVDVADGTDFHVFGATTLPRSRVDLRWTGASDPADTPLFFGSLVAASIDSTMTSGASMGVVCCERPRSDRVRVEAAVDGTIRAVAVVSIAARPDGAPGHLIGVEDWQLCVHRSCADREDTTPP